MKKINFSLMKEAKSAFFMLFLLLSNVAIAQLQPGDWCSSSLCSDCVSYMSGSNTQEKPRVMYVNDFVSFVSNDRFKTASGTTTNNPNDAGIIGPNEHFYDTDKNKSILGLIYKEIQLLEYAVDAGFNELILYNIPALFRRGDYYFDRDPSMLLFPQELERFIIMAKQVYNVKISIAAPSTSVSSMWENINSFYNGQLNQPFVSVSPCDENTDWLNGLNNGGSIGGGYYELKDVITYYETDPGGNPHPYDEVVIDVTNSIYHKKRAEVLMQYWWESIDVAIRNRHPHVGHDGCYNKYVKGNPGSYSGSHACLSSQACNSYEAVVTEFEFWNDDRVALTKHQDDITNYPDSKVWDIEYAYNEYVELLKMLECLQELLTPEIKWDVSEDPDEEPIEVIIGLEGNPCPLNTHTYLAQLTSSGFTYHGTKLGDNHYVLGSSWEISSGNYHTLASYDYDAVNHTMADEIDARVSRIYLNTYKETPCHLWSDDLIRYNNSYRRRFKDVYRYFSDNNIGALSGNKTEIFPLFSARHSAIEPNQPSPRDHLGLYLSNTGVNGFTGSLGGAEITFREFSENIHDPHGCDFTGGNSPYGDLNINVSAPTNNASTSIGNPTPLIWAGSYFELSNVVLGESYEITSLNHPADYLTVRYGTSDGDVVQYGTGNVRITASKSGTYYVHIARNGGSSCMINGSAPSQREIEIRHINSTHYSFSDPIFWPVNEFDNVINGYCWYRYSELGGLHPGISPFKKKENEITSIEEKLEEKINIFPNPAKDLIQLSGINEGLFEFYDISGKHIFGGKIMNAEISTQNLQSGFYLLRLSNPSIDITRKVIIQK